MTVKSNRINTSVSFAFANIAENSLEVKQGDLLSFTADGFVTKATPETVIIGIANDKFSFPETNETQEQWRVDYNPVIWENTYKMEVTGDIFQVKVGHFYTMDANQKLDVSTDSPSVGQFMVQDVYANCVDVRFVTNLGLAIDQYEDVRLVAVYPTNPESTPFDGQYTFELSNGTKIDGDFSDLCWFSGDVTIDGNLTVNQDLTVTGDASVDDLSVTNIIASGDETISGTLGVTGKTTLGQLNAGDTHISNALIDNASIDILATESMEIQDLDVTNNLTVENNLHVDHDVDIDEDLNVDGSAHIGESATVDHILTVGEQLVLGSNAIAPQFVMESTRNQANGFAGLNANGQLDNSVLPPLAIGETYVEDTEQKMLALQAQTGDVCVRTDEQKTYIKLNDNNPATLADWQTLLFPGQNAWGQITGNLSDQTDLMNALNTKLEASQLKTVNGESLVGTGDIEVDGIVKSATAPENPTQGDVYYNTTDDTIYSYNGEERVAVGSGSFDPNGYYPALHAGLADNLYTNDNIIDVDTWNFRTTAGSQSVPSSGTASLNYIRGNMIRRIPKTDCIINYNTSDGIFVTNVNKYQTINATSNTTGTYTFTLTSGVWDTNPSTYGLTVSLQQAEFTITNGTFSDSTGDIFKAYVTTSRGSFRLLYDTDNSVWTLSNGTDTRTDADTTTFGITTPGSTTDVVHVNYYDECTDGTLELDYTAEDAGWLTVYHPTDLVATGVNQFDGNTILANVEIDNGEIVSGNNYIVRCPAYGGVVNGYMAYCPDGYIVNCGRVDGLENEPMQGVSVDTTGAIITATECSMPHDTTGYFVVEVSQSLTDSEISLHPKRSGQQDTNTDAYTESVLTLPGDDVNGTPLPASMPRIGDVYDEFNFQTQTYIQRIQRIFYSESDLADVAAMGVDFDYDENYIYYVLGNPVTYQLEFDNTYTANDYGTETMFTGGTIASLQAEISTSYGSNLVDKLRTGVVTKEEYPQVIDQDDYDALPATKNTDGIIRFIFTEEA